jgi:hypothetical protein
MSDLAERNQWRWKVRLLPNPDFELAKVAAVVASSDSVVLDRCSNWVNLTREITEARLPETHLVDLS